MSRLPISKEVICWCRMDSFMFVSFRISIPKGVVCDISVAGVVSE